MKLYVLVFYFEFVGLLSFFCPCIQFGRNAEALGESCVTYALSQFVPILNIYCKTVVRGRIREQKGIEGTCLKDFLCSWCCYKCTIAQEALVCVEHGLFNILTFIDVYYTLLRNCKDLVVRIWFVNEQTIVVLIN